MKKAELHRLGWNKIDVPDWLPDFVTKLKDVKKINSLYHSLVKRDVGTTFFQYCCHGCSYKFTSERIGEEIGGCRSCSSGELTASIMCEPQNFLRCDVHDLISYTQNHLTSLISNYYGNSTYIDQKDFGFEKEGYYFEFSRGSIGYGSNLKTAIMHAAITQPELWNFKFNWDKVGTRSIKLHRIISCL